MEAPTTDINEILKDINQEIKRQKKERAHYQNFALWHGGINA